MLNATRAIARTVDLKIGWNRIGIAVSLMIASIAAATLYNLLRDIRIDRVMVALRDRSSWTILTAGCFVAAGYVTLTFYDFFSLRTIGRSDVPYRVAALASFTSYSIGHNLGATVFTAAIVRLRIYSAWGLGVLDIAKMGFVTGLTFWPFSSTTTTGQGASGWQPRPKSLKGEVRIDGLDGKLTVVFGNCNFRPNPTSEASLISASR